MAFWDELQPASYRGIPFGVLGGEIKFGRRNAIHEYPKRDEVWVEDMGRSARRITMSGFLVENSLVYGGGSVIAQRERLIAACEAPGDGELVHPTLGRLTVSMLDGSAGEELDKGRVFEIKFSFIVGGKRIFPTTVASTGNAVQAAGAAAHAAASASFLSTALGALKSGAAVVGLAVSTVSTWTRTAMTLVNDATSIYHAIAAIPSTFGKFFGGRRKGATNFAAGIQGTVGAIQRTASGISGAASTVQSLGALATVTRNTVTTAASTLTSVASLLGL